MYGCATTGFHSREYHYNKARELLEGERYTDAVDYLTAEAKKCDDWRFYFYRGFAYYYLDKYDKALTDYNMAIAMEDEYPLLFANRGNTYFKLGKSNKAIDDYERGIELFDKGTRERIIRGVVFQRKDIKGDYLEQAITDETIEGKRGKAVLFYNIGYVYENKKDIKDTIINYDLAIETDDTYVPAYYRRGMTYLKKNELDKALDDFSRAVLLSPDQASLYCIRGETYRAMKKYDLALANFSKAISLNPNFGRAYYCRSLTLKVLDRGDEAKVDFLKSLELGFKPSKSEIVLN